MRLLLRAGLKRAVVVGIDDLLWMPVPRAVGGGVVHGSVEGGVALRAGPDEFNRVVGEDVARVSRRDVAFAVAHHLRVDVGPAAETTEVVAREAVAGKFLLAEVPFTR